MNKHERAKRIIQRDLEIVIGAEITDSLVYALRVLEAVEGVEGWMPRHMRGKPHLEPVDEATGDEHIASVIQAILDAKSDDA